MYSLTIQGTHTNSFTFKSNSGHEFRSLVESLVLNYVVLICSKYRIDLIYFSDRDRQEDIMKAWCKVVGKEFNSDVKRKFIRSSNHKETLENYFVSLIYLTRIPNWFQDYHVQLHRTIRQEPNHPILKEIIGCARHLAARKESELLPLIEADKHTVAFHILGDTKSFASEAAKKFFNN